MWGGVEWGDGLGYVIIHCGICFDGCVSIAAVARPTSHTTPHHQNNQIWRYEGALGFFKGCVPNVLKTAPSAAITFLCYEECIKALNAYRGGAGRRKGKEDLR